MKTNFDIKIEYVDDYLENELPPAMGTNVKDPYKPEYYQGDGMDAFAVIRKATENLSGHLAFTVGNIIKYAIRWPYKGGKESLYKIKEYLNDLSQEDIKYIGKNCPNGTDTLNFHYDIRKAFKLNYSDDATRFYSLRIIDECYAITYINSFKKDVRNSVDAIIERLKEIEKDGTN